MATPEADDRRRSPFVISLLLGALFVTGPAVWYLLDALQHGPSGANIPMVIPAVGLYLLWSGVALWLPPQVGRGVEVGCFLLLVSIVAMLLLAGLATQLPLPQDSRSISELGLLLLAYFPWLLLQYVALVAILFGRAA